MTEEDRTASKLKGYNCLVKFKDGEELLLDIPEFIDQDATSEWFVEVEKFINGGEGTYFPVAGIAISHGAIKYVIKI